jgi:hypothetical protein
MKEMFRVLLDNLVATYGLPGVQTDEQGIEALVVIDDFEVALRLVSAGYVLISTVVAPLPENNRERVLEALLDGNTFFYQTRGFALAAREDTGVTLQGIISLRVLDGPGISSVMQHFISVARYWQQFCMDAETSAENDGAFGDAGLPGGPGLPEDIGSMDYLRV